MRLPVSVVIPSFNRPKQIKIILKKVLENTPSEVIIVDDCSDAKEEYESIINDFKNDFQDVNLKLIRNKINKGASISRHIGFSQVSSDYVLFIDDDILLSQGYIENLFKTITLYDNCVTASGKIGLVTSLEEFENRQSVKSIDLFDIKKLNVINCSTLRIDPNKINRAKPGVYHVEFTWNPLLWRVNFLKENKIEFFPYRGNGYREETDPQIQAAKCGGLILLNTNVECYHWGIKNEGGQWGKGLFKNYRWYFSSLKNNWIFLNRHYDYLRKTANFNSKLLLQINFSVRLLSVFIPNCIKNSLK
ncbi:glycosyltransferase family 2 protein [Vibrio fluvialis]|uniref:glycosyltransferase family 2 protein n=1 Tax=Vibrio fluvialis TaxID=676 RepID=UPI001404DB11|nr:glycosyltransferase family 2 protein [Vibrio fluvialis]EKO3980629.1 glycosyltransferase family 2 protein [Vibrio fluvialis]NHN72894.1 glycosyltransferase family 2 protein [Vibrio fluvialis]